MTGPLAGLELSVAGAGPAYTDRPGAAGAAYLVRTGGSTLLLDFGQGSFPRVAGTLDPADLTAVFVSHLHPDHFIDLISLRHYLRWECRPPRRIDVLAPAGLEERLDALLGEPGFCAAALDIRPLAQGIREIGPFVVESRLVTHTNESYAFRVSLMDAPVGQAGLVYSGDCGDATDLGPLVRPGDIVLVEVSAGPGPVAPGAEHLDGPAVGALATATGAGQVLLTHLQMGFDIAATLASVASGYGGPIRFVWPGDRLDL